jgi:hypothetical protein
MKQDNEEKFSILIANYTDLRTKPGLLKIAAIKEIEKRKHQLYDKWIGTFMEPVLREEIDLLRSLIRD